METNTLAFIENELNLNLITCFTLYKDEFDFLINNTQEDEHDTTNMNGSLQDDKKPNLFDDNIMRNQQLTVEEMNIDDEDELLYGSSKTEMPFFTNSASNAMDTETDGPDTKANDQLESDTNESGTKSKKAEQTVTTFWLTTVNSNGVLTIFNLDEDNINQVYSVPKFNMAPKTLVLNNHLVDEETKSVVNPVNPPRSSLMDSYQAQVHEILMIGAGTVCRWPFLVIYISIY